MKKIKFKELLNCIFITCVILSNIVASKMLYLNEISIFNVGTLLFILTYPISNIITKKYGKDESSKTLKLGFIASIITTILITLLGLIPTKDVEIQNAYNLLLSSNWIFVLGSMAGYLTSHYTNRLIFSKSKKQNLLINQLSNLVGTITDTVVFDTLTFGLGFGWILNNPKGLISMIITTIIGKLIIQYLYSFIFMLTKRKKEK